MARISKVRTRTGDDGTTALGTGQRVPKSATRIRAYGTIDELNSQLGVVLAGGLAAGLVEPLRHTQNDLLIVGAELCIPVPDRDRHAGPRVEQRHVERLEHLLDELNGQLGPLTNFVLPGGDPIAAHLHVARTVCRRAECEIVALAASEAVEPLLLKYVNRLSDALFVMARFQNKAVGVTEPIWDSRA